MSAYRIETDRLIARCWSPEDAPAFRALLDRNDRHLRPFIPWMRDEPQPLEKTQERLVAYQGRFHAGEDFRYALLDRAERLIGEFMMSTRTGEGTREVGYLVDKNATGRGYAVEITAGGIRVAFELHGVKRVELHCCPENTASVRIAEKLGFKLASVHKDYDEDSEGVVRDLMIWALTAEDYPGSLASQAAVKAFDREGRSVF